MAQYLTTAYVDAMMSARTRTRLFTDDEQVGFDTTAFNIVVAAATAKVRSRLSEAGYTPPDDLDDTSKISAEGADLIRVATFEVFKRMAYQRKLLPVDFDPPHYKTIADELGSGDADPESLTPNAATAVGGVSFTESSSTVSGSVQRIFPRTLMR